VRKLMLACAGLGLLLGGYCHYYRVVRTAPPPLPYEQRYASDDGGPEYITMGRHEFQSWVKGGYCPGGVRIVRYRDVRVIVHLCEM